MLLPGVAQVAMQQGAHAVENILRHFGNQPRREFRYRNYGNMATIGRNSAIADFGGRWTFSGGFAWLLWVFVHIMQLTGFRNRLAVLIQWAWAYLTHQRGIRLITGHDPVEAPASPSSRSRGSGATRHPRTSNGRRHRRTTGSTVMWLWNNGKPRLPSGY